MYHGYGASGDFDIEDRVPATEGEAVVRLGTYGDEIGLGDEGDFGNIGLNSFGDEADFGEVDSYDTMSFGDFEDNYGSDDEPSMGQSMDGGEGAMGFKMKKMVKKLGPGKHLAKAKGLAKKGGISKFAKKASPMSHVKIKKPVPSFVKPVQSALQKHQKAIVTQKVNAFKNAHKKTIEAAQAKALATGRPIPKVMDFMPAETKKAIATEATQKAAAIVQATKVVGRNSGVPNVSVGTTIAKISKKFRKQPTVKPSAPQGVVAAPAGQRLSVSSVSTPAISSPQAVSAKASHAAYAHPLLAHVRPMGDDADFGYDDEAMGFDIKGMLRDLDRKRLEAQKALIAKTTAQAKTAASNLLATSASRIASDPKVKALAVEEAKQAAASKVATAILDPANQKKAAIGMGTVAALAVGFLAWKKFANK